MDYKRNQKYFRGVNYLGAIIIIVIGVLVLLGALAGLFEVAGAVVIGLVLLAIGIAIIIICKRGAVTDAEYDASVASMLNNIQEKALNKLGIDEHEVKEMSPIPFDGYVYQGAAHAKKGDDGLWRTNRYEVVILFFSKHEVHCYTYCFDTTSPKRTEATDTCFYKDIVSVSTGFDTVHAFGRDIDYEYLELTTAGGTTLSLSLHDIDDAQRSINAIRALLRTKKQG